MRHWIFETVQMDKEKRLAFVTVHGSANSHTAILARMMNIPALIGVPVELREIRIGMRAVVDRMCWNRSQKNEMEGTNRWKS